MIDFQEQYQKETKHKLYIKPNAKNQQNSHRQSW